MLPDHALRWLRDGDVEADAAAAAVTLGLMARRTPAWRERYVALLDRCADAAANDAATLLVVLGLRAMAAPAAAPPLDGVLRVWPSSVVDGAKAALGLLLYDNRHGTDVHTRVAVPWWHDARDRVSDRDALAAACWAAPQFPADARALFARRVGDDAGMAALLAHEWGLADPATSIDAWAVAADVCALGGWSRLCGAPLPPCPTVVDVDPAELVLRRAEWVAGSLYLGLAPEREDPAARTSFRLVGAEPRVWCTAGVDDVMLDVTAREVSIRVPLVAAELVFTPGSY